LAEIAIRYFGSLREIAGKRFEKISIEDSATLRDLLQKLTEKHGSRFRNFVYSRNEKPRDGIAFAVDGDTIQTSKLNKIACKQVNEFVILPPISGGSLGAQS
jgi:MoaD family protein